MLIAELSFANSQLLKNCNVMNIELTLFQTGRQSSNCFSYLFLRLLLIEYLKHYLNYLSLHYEDFDFPCLKFESIQATQIWHDYKALIWGTLWFKVDLICLLGVSRFSSCLSELFLAVIFQSRYIFSTY